MSADSYGKAIPKRRTMDRRRFLRLGGAGLAGAVALGSSGTAALSRTPEGSSLPDRRLVKEFEEAASEYGVPADLLIAMGFVNTRWEMPPPQANDYRKRDPHGWGSYGIMALVQNPFSDTLGEASRLTGIPEERLKRDRAANIRGGAALLARAAGGDGKTSRYLSAVAGRGAASGANYETVAGVGGGELYAGQVLEAIESGVAAKLRARDASVFRDSPSSQESGYELSAVRRKPSVVWYPAHSGNYTAANRPRSHRIRYIVIHVTQGSWSSAINWFQTRGAHVSAHYVIRSRDGRRAQCVSDMNIAWHAGNWWYNKHSIGIEHEGYVSDPGWFTPEMYRSSAKLVAYLCRRYRIPVRRSRIIGHNEVPGADHTDPGRWWWWSYYMRRVRRFAR